MSGFGSVRVCMCCCWFSFECGRKIKKKKPEKIWVSSSVWTIFGLVSPTSILCWVFISFWQKFSRIYSENEQPIKYTNYNMQANRKLHYKSVRTPCLLIPFITGFCFRFIKQNTTIFVSYTYHKDKTKIETEILQNTIHIDAHEIRVCSV